MLGYCGSCSHQPPPKGTNMTDYIARQAALRAKREAEGYYTPEQVARREARLQASRDYNARIAGIADQMPRNRAKVEREAMVRDDD